MRDWSATAFRDDVIAESLSRVTLSLELLRDTAFSPEETVSARRRPARKPFSSAPCKSRMIFSQRNGRVVASWTGVQGYVDLGSTDEVAEMMRDYLAQTALAERLIALTK